MPVIYVVSSFPKCELLVLPVDNSGLLEDDISVSCSWLQAPQRQLTADVRFGHSSCDIRGRFSCSVVSAEFF